MEPSNDQVHAMTTTTKRQVYKLIIEVDNNRMEGKNGKADDL